MNSTEKPIHEMTAKEMHAFMTESGGGLEPPNPHGLTAEEYRAALNEWFIAGRVLRWQQEGMPAKEAVLRIARYTLQCADEEAGRARLDPRFQPVFSREYLLPAIEMALGRPLDPAEIAM